MKRFVGTCFGKGKKNGEGAKSRTFSDGQFLSRNQGDEMSQGGSCALRIGGEILIGGAPAKYNGSILNGGPGKKKGSKVRRRTEQRGRVNFKKKKGGKKRG